MACHESPIGDEYACVGWLADQLGPGHNMALRYAVATGAVTLGALDLDGEQFESLEAMSKRKN
jgi:nitrate/nitrite transporter NarK